MKKSTHQLLLPVPAVLITLAMICLLQSVCFESKAQQAITAADSNIIHLADPTIFPYNKKYYLYGTGEQRSGGGFVVYVSNDLRHWELSDKNDGVALKKGDAYGDKGFWAPQVFQYRQKFYMAYVANEQIAIAESDDPAGPFTQKNKIALPSSGKQIDPFVFLENGKAYLYHVRLTNGNRIFVAELNEDLTAVKEQTARECISAELPWENTAKAAWPVAEGPTVFKRGKTYYLFYSANDFRNPDYAVGYATSTSAIGPWTKYAGNPVLSRAITGKNGSGHGDFFAGYDKQLYYVFHTHDSESRVGPRKTAIVKVDTKNQGAEAFVFEKGSFRYLYR